MAFEIWRDILRGSKPLPPCKKEEMEEFVNYLNEGRSITQTTQKPSDVYPILEEECDRTVRGKKCDAKSTLIMDTTGDKPIYSSECKGICRKDETRKSRE